MLHGVNYALNKYYNIMQDVRIRTSLLIIRRNIYRATEKSLYQPNESNLR